MLEVILTKDGSHTLKNTKLNETYHSIHGAVQESLHVFIKHGLEFKIEQDLQEMSILEIGFGTGLNAWLSAKRSLEIPNPISYTSLEPFPVDQSIWSKLNYAANAIDLELFSSLHEARWNQPVSITPGFTLHKSNLTLQQAILPALQFDIIYFDAFAPEKQPEIWAIGVLEKVTAAMKSGAVFVTYCAKGRVKRDLKSLGLKVETLPGPPGKREMIRAVRD